MITRLGVFSRLEMLRSCDLRPTNQQVQNFCKTFDSPKYKYIYIYMRVCVCVPVFFWLGWIVWLIKPWRIFYAKSALYIYMYTEYVICINVLSITFLNKSELIFLSQLNGFNHFCQCRIILFAINYLFVHIEMDMHSRFVSELFVIV